MWLKNKQVLLFQEGGQGTDKLLLVDVFYCNTRHLNEMQEIMCVTHFSLIAFPESTVTFNGAYLTLWSFYMTTSDQTSLVFNKVNNTGPKSDTDESHRSQDRQTHPGRLALFGRSIRSLCVPQSHETKKILILIILIQDFSSLRWRYPLATRPHTAAWGQPLRTGMEQRPKDLSLIFLYKTNTNNIILVSQSLLRSTVGHISYVMGVNDEFTGLFWHIRWNTD